MVSRLWAVVFESTKGRPKGRGYDQGKDRKRCLDIQSGAPSKGKRARPTRRGENFLQKSLKRSWSLPVLGEEILMPTRGFEQRSLRPRPRTCRRIILRGRLR